MADRKIDRELLIDTTGLREWSRKEAHNYNRTESTPYLALDELFKVYKVKEGDKLVDFGCGRGRVAFYIHHVHSIPVRGVELHDLTFDELVDNKRSYKRNKNLENPPIFFEYGYADKYEIKDDENIFYFFNPFSVKIFRKVVDNILKSLEKNDRETDIILYYPLNSFKKHLETKTTFKRLETIRLPWKKDKKKKFIVYRHSPESLE